MWVPSRKIECYCMQLQFKYISSDLTMQRTNGKAKEIADYYECLMRSKALYRFHYILVLEDDAEPASFDVIEQISNVVIPLVMKEKRDLLFAKLIHSLNYQGFSLEWEMVLEVTAFALLIFYISYVGLFIVSNIVFESWLGSTHVISRSYSPTRITLAALISITALLVVLALGRQATL